MSDELVWERYSISVGAMGDDQLEAFRPAAAQIWRDNVLRDGAFPGPGEPEVTVSSPGWHPESRTIHIAGWVVRSVAPLPVLGRNPADLIELIRWAGITRPAVAWREGPKPDVTVSIGVGVMEALRRHVRALGLHRPTSWIAESDSLPVHVPEETTVFGIPVTLCDECPRDRWQILSDGRVILAGRLDGCDKMP